MALPSGAARLLAEGLEKAKRLPVVWLWFQECTGCTESLTPSHAPSLEQLLLDWISLDYHHTLQAASSEAAEAAREATLKAHAGELFLIVDGSVPTVLDHASPPAVFPVHDLDRGGYLSPKEFAALAEQRAQRRGEGCWAALLTFEALDADRDGRIGEDEVLNHHSRRPGRGER